MNGANAESLSDELLNAFIDGELTEKEMQRVELQIANSDELKARQASIIALKQNLRSAFADEASKLDQHSTDAEHFVQHGYTLGATEGKGSKTENNSRIPIFAAAACLLLGLLSGVLGYRYLVGNPNSADDRLVAVANPELPAQSWLLQMANYQEMYTLATLSHVQKAGDEALQDDLNRWQEAVDAKLVVPDLDSQGVGFRRGQILQSNAVPVIQLAYLSAEDGKPVAVCITPKRANTASESGSLVSRFGDLNYVHWQQGQLEIAVMAKLPSARLQELKRLVAESFSAAS